MRIIPNTEAHVWPLQCRGPTVHDHLRGRTARDWLHREAESGANEVLSSNWQVAYMVQQRIMELDVV